MSPTVKSVCLLLLLCQCLQIMANRKRNSVTTNVLQQVPSFNDQLPAGSIVQLIQYVVPKSTGKLKKRNKVKPKFVCKKKALNRELINLRHAPLPPVENPINFLLKVLEENRVICMASLIKVKLVLSSANCFPKKPIAELYQLQEMSNQTYKIDEIILDTTLGYNLAVIKLEVGISDTAVQPVPLCNQLLGLNDTVNMYMSRLHVNFLRTQIIGNAACKQSFLQNELVFITEHMICVHNSNVAKDCELTMKGDPLLHEGQLCGINIYGPNCVDGAVNGDLYVDIFQARDFIEGLIKAN